jgi:phosphoglycerate dehydrogenase-like enzyme
LPDKAFLPAEKSEFLAGLDFLIVAMPLTAKTEGIIGRAELQALPDHAYILNPARGPIIEQTALLEALDNKTIAGAALDTHYHYPMPADHVLWRYPNVIMTPHISGSSANARFTTRIWSIFTENVERFLGEKPLLNELTPQELNGES